MQQKVEINRLKTELDHRETELKDVQSSISAQRTSASMKFQRISLLEDSANKLSLVIMNSEHEQQMSKLRKTVETLGSKYVTCK